ncbi:hypothetical protein LR393_17185 [Kineosporia mesophila]|uniref:hypothetical protein n=1 Tax=Kineosporia mesophila TaxID=566012 RepID=UPI001E2DDB19|nr:hypothetical protein [Kineosporia mesophila]MCD5351805.1 hypothetical protein [Kineosporia mesophila]
MIDSRSFALDVPPLFARAGRGPERAARGAGGGFDGQIAAATRGGFGDVRFGDVRFTDRTSGSTLFVNPLMAIYFTVGLDALAARCLYRERIDGTVLMRQVATRIRDFRNEVTPRVPRAFPH